MTGLNTSPVSPIIPVCFGNTQYTAMSLLQVPYLIEAPPNGSAICHKIVAPPQNRSAQPF